MEPNRPTRSLPLLIAPLVAFLLVAGCGSRVGATTGDRPEPTFIIGSSGIEPGEVAPAMPAPDGMDQPVDRSDPAAVAKTFVTVATNRLPGEAIDRWKRELQLWSTPDALDLATVGGSEMLDEEIDSRGGRRIGSVVGYAVLSSTAGTAVVVVLCDETLVFDGLRLDEQNFVTWRIGLDRGSGGWLVSSVGLGSGS